MKNHLKRIASPRTWLINRKSNTFITRPKPGAHSFEHGISLGQTAQLLGISQWELMKYIGHTKITEGVTEKVSVRTRLKYVDELFGL